METTSENDFFNAATPAPKDSPFLIDTEARADWYLNKLATIDAEADRIKANTARRLQELATDREGLVQRFGDQLTGWAKEEAERRPPQDGGRYSTVRLSSAPCLRAS